MKRFAGRAVLAMALTLAAALALSGSAFAQYGYYDNYDQGSPWRAHQYGFQNGFHDGFRKGHHEGRACPFQDDAHLLGPRLQQASQALRSAREGLPGPAVANDLRARTAAVPRRLARMSSSGTGR